MVTTMKAAGERELSDGNCMVVAVMAQGEVQYPYG